MLTIIIRGIDYPRLQWIFVGYRFQSGPWFGYEITQSIAKPIGSSPMSEVIDMDGAMTFGKVPMGLSIQVRLCNIGKVGRDKVMTRWSKCKVIFWRFRTGEHVLGIYSCLYVPLLRCIRIRSVSSLSGCFLRGHLSSKLCNVQNWLKQRCLHPLWN